MNPWNDWYHVMGHTYGTWLPGSSKGFRTRHHRFQVDGDYRNPPPKRKYDPRRWVGIAKKESSHYCKVTGDAPEGGLWGTRCECVPINDKSHRLNVIDYILDHAKRGAAVYQPALLPDLRDFDPGSLLIS